MPFLYLVAPIDDGASEKEKSSRQSRELEVFSFISRLTVKIPKALRDRKPKYSISTTPDYTGQHRTLFAEQWKKITMLFVFYYTTFFLSFFDV
jgi:hypothetical protein